MRYMNEKSLVVQYRPTGGVSCTLKMGEPRSVGANVNVRVQDFMGMHEAIFAKIK